MTPNIIRNAENLLANSSLDNPDLTITSLKYIDEHHNGCQFYMNGCHATETTNGIKPLTAYFSNQSGNLAENLTIPASCGLKGSTVEEVKTTTTVATIVPTTARCQSMVEGSVVIGSNGGLEKILTATLSPNSSKAPLIEQKNECLPNQTAVTSAEDHSGVSMLFSFLQILTATFGSFAHGGNDVR